MPIDCAFSTALPHEHSTGIRSNKLHSLTIADTKIKSPYNTYQNPGLPPGPIGNPSIDAIKDVLNAEATEFLYFVADNKGHHRFTKTYAEHLKKIEEINEEK